VPVSTAPPLGSEFAWTRAPARIERPHLLSLSYKFAQHYADHEKTPLRLTLAISGVEVKLERLSCWCCNAEVQTIKMPCAGTSTNFRIVRLSYVKYKDDTLRTKKDEP
jgi:hypothetical protein